MKELVILFEYKNEDLNILWAPEYKIYSIDSKIWSQGRFYDDAGQWFEFTVFDHDNTIMVINLPSVEFDEQRDMLVSSGSFKMLADLIDEISKKMKEFEGKNDKTSKIA